MTITLTEMFLLGWAVVMTVLWIGAKARYRMVVHSSLHALEAVADKQVELYRDNEGNVKVRGR
jgi:hypothetical protein